MQPWTIKTESYFDGETLYDQGPYFLLVENGKIAAIGQGEDAGNGDKFAAHPQETTRFLMPGLTEAHAHLFLDGSNLEFAARSAYMKGPVDAMMAMARQNVADSLACGITLIRDAGDKFGVNHAIRDEVNAANNGPIIRSAGLALHRKKNYGAFMSRPVEGNDDIRAAIEETAKNSDDLKIILTGIIDFETGLMKGKVQFSVDELKLMIRTGKQHGLKTFAHCSGIDGIRVAAEAGIGSIEHGFFMDRVALEQLAEKQIAWVPTYSPVHFQGAHPEYAKWSPETVAKLQKIVADHLEHSAMAVEIGAPIVAGSDAGSHGVPHGTGLIDELFFMIEAGLPMLEILTAATSRPRRLWGAKKNYIQEGAEAEFITMTDTPFKQPDALRNVERVVREGNILHRAHNTQSTTTTA